MQRPQKSNSLMRDAEASTKLDQDFEAKRNAKWGLDGFKIEPKLRPKEPIKNDDSPCKKTIERNQWLQERWNMKGLQLVGEQAEDEKLTDAERCERFNSRQAIASNGKLLRLDYILTR